MKTLIKVSCVDQSLRLTNTPKIASGGVEEDRLHVDFCPMWDGFAKVAVFYRNIENPYRVALDGAGECLIPSVVLVDPGLLYFAVYGTKDGVTRTSEVVAYRVWEGAITGAAEAPPEPPASLVEQVLELLESKSDKGHSHTPAEIGAAPAEHSHDLSGLGVASADHTHTPDEVGAAPAEHTHTPEDIGAAPAAHTHTPDEAGAAPAEHTHTPEDIGAAHAPIIAQNVEVGTDAWVADTTFAEYPYRAAAVVSGAAENMLANVVYAPTESDSGDYSKQTAAYDGGVYIYAKEVPAAAITLLTVYLFPVGGAV